MERSKYKNAKIYKITDIGYNKCYIGSTCENLSQRMARHRQNHKKAEEWNTKTTCCLLFDEYGMDNCKIELIETYPCENREQLLKQEGYHIKNTDCVNRCVAGRTINEWKEDNQEHYQQMRKEYSEKNKEHISKKSHEYYHQNKETISEKRKEPIVCECGSVVRKSDIRKHEKSEKHTRYINKNINI